MTLMLSIFLRKHGVQFILFLIDLWPLNSILCFYEAVMIHPCIPVLKCQDTYVVVFNNLLSVNLVLINMNL